MPIRPPLNEFDFNLCNTTQCEALPAIGSSSLRLCADPPKAGQRPPPDGHWRGGQRPAHRTRCMAGARPRRATRCGSGGESAAGSVTGPPPTPGPRPPQVPAGAARGEGLPLGDRLAPVGRIGHEGTLQHGSERHATNILQNQVQKKEVPKTTHGLDPQGKPGLGGGPQDGRRHGPCSTSSENTEWLDSGIFRWLRLCECDRGGTAQQITTQGYTETHCASITHQHRVNFP